MQGSDESRRFVKNYSSANRTLEKNHVKWFSREPLRFSYLRQIALVLSLVETFVLQLGYQREVIVTHPVSMLLSHCLEQSFFCKIDVKTVKSRRGLME